jgi:hypothetical protein
VRGLIERDSGAGSFVPTIMAARRWRRCFPDLWLCPLLGKADVRADMAISTRVTHSRGRE